MVGAEAVVRKTRFLSRDCVVKNRIRKNYRVRQLDELLRKMRTKNEARLLHKAKAAGVLCPTVLCVEDFSITMTFITGKRPKMDARISKKAGEYLALLHNNSIVHGDYTPANLLKAKNNLFVIDFGLGFFSNDVEDFAVDVFTMLKAIDQKRHKDFLEGYSKCAKYNAVLKRLGDISSRMRYGGSSLFARGNLSLGKQSL